MTWLWLILSILQQIWVRLNFPRMNNDDATVTIVSDVSWLSSCWCLSIFEYQLKICFAWSLCLFLHDPIPGIGLPATYCMCTTKIHFETRFLKKKILIMWHNKNILNVDSEKTKYSSLYIQKNQWPACKFPFLLQWPPDLLYIQRQTLLSNSIIV